MSTKAINALIRWVSSQDVDDTAFDGTHIGPPIVAARVEVENIERTAKEFVAAPLDPERRVNLYNMARAIAKDAK
jgi:hypothetical protein